MASIEQFRISVRRDGDEMVVVSTSADGTEHRAAFAPPDEDGRAVHRLAGRVTRLRSHDRAPDIDNSPDAHRAVGPTMLRDVGATDDDGVADAQRIGSALADSLLVGPIGAAYDAARRRCRQADCRLRLTLSFDGAPELFARPWELMYRHTGFLGCQRDTPLVRHLGIGEPAGPPAIEQSVRMLVVLASPLDLPPLDLAAEREIIEVATRPVVDARRLTIDWLVDASRQALHTALRESSYHILHVVAHGGMGRDGAGALYLQDEHDGRSQEVSAADLRTLLDSQHELRVAVLNACHGARSGTDNATGHLAGALVQRGVPAVIGMQFPISDCVALTFAAELYRHLIGGHEPIDVAVAAARLAIYVEVDRLEWATPVLYVRDADAELFRFLVAALVIPPLVAIGQQLAPGLAAPGAGSGHSAIGGARPRGLLPSVLSGGATVSVVAAAVLLWPHPQQALAGSWTTDDWTAVSSSPDEVEARSLPDYQLTIEPEPAVCPADACALDVTLTNPDTGHTFDVPMEPTGTFDSWVGLHGESWNCLDDAGNVTVERASEGTAEYTMRRRGDDVTLAYSYEATTTITPTEMCIPLQTVDFTTTLRQE